MRLDNQRLVDLLGVEPHTPLDQAIAAALTDMGCLAPIAEPCPPWPCLTLHRRRYKMNWRTYVIAQTPGVAAFNTPCNAA